MKSVWCLGVHAPLLFMPCVCSVSSWASEWIPSIPLHSVCVCVWMQKQGLCFHWEGRGRSTFETCTFSTQLKGPLRSLNVHSLGRDTGGESAAKQTHRGLYGATVPNTVAYNRLGGSGSQVQQLRWGSLEGVSFHSSITTVKWHNGSLSCLKEDFPDIILLWGLCGHYLTSHSNYLN